MNATENHISKDKTTSTANTHAEGATQAADNITNGTASAAATPAAPSAATTQPQEIDGVSWNWAATHRGEPQPAYHHTRPAADARQAPQGQPHQTTDGATGMTGAAAGAATAARTGTTGNTTGSGVPADARVTEQPNGYTARQYPQPPYRNPYVASGAYPAPAMGQKPPKKPSKIKAFFASLNAGTIACAAIAALLCGLIGGLAGGYIVRATMPSRQQQTVQPYGYGRMMPGSSNGNSRSGSSSDNSESSSSGNGYDFNSIFNDADSM